MTARTFDLHSRIKGVTCGAARVTAGGAGDATAVTGVTINRKTAGSPGFDACSLLFNALVTLASGKKLSVAIEVQEADESTTPGTAGTFGTATALQASTSVGLTGVQTAAVTQVRLEDTGFKSRKQYVRYNFTPDLDASGTDIADVSLSAILGGSDIGPTS